MAALHLLGKVIEPMNVVTKRPDYSDEEDIVLSLNWDRLGNLRHEWSLYVEVSSMSEFFEYPTEVIMFSPPIRWDYLHDCREFQSMWLNGSYISEIQYLIEKLWKEK